jgi:hypothetical protein
MTRVRGQRRWLAALWLYSQLITLAFTSSTIAAMSPERKHCDCPGTTARVCVMHRGSAQAPLEARQCAMRHSATPDVTIITVAPGFSPAPAVRLHEAEARPAPAAIDPILTLDRSAPPEAPPPRA